MFKHNIKYTDFNGIERDEDFYFHLSIPEVARIEAKLGGPIETYTKTIAAEHDVDKLLEFVETIVLQAYGKKTLDGKSFIKNRELREEFEYSQAYAELFEQLLTDKEFAQQFGSKVAETAKHQQKKNQVDPKVVSNA